MAASIALFLLLFLSALAASWATPCGPFWATAEPTLMSLQLPAKEKPIELQLLLLQLQLIPSCFASRLRFTV